MTRSQLARCVGIDDRRVLHKTRVSTIFASRTKPTHSGSGSGIGLVGGGSGRRLRERLGWWQRFRLGHRRMRRGRNHTGHQRAHRANPLPPLVDLTLGDDRFVPAVALARRICTCHCERHGDRRPRRALHRRGIAWSECARLSTAEVSDEIRRAVHRLPVVSADRGPVDQLSDARGPEGPRRQAESHSAGAADRRQTRSVRRVANADRARRRADARNRSPDRRPFLPSSPTSPHA